MQIKFWDLNMPQMKQTPTIPPQHVRARAQYSHTPTPQVCRHLLYTTSVLTSERDFLSSSVSFTTEQFVKYFSQKLCARAHTHVQWWKTIRPGWQTAHAAAPLLLITLPTDRCVFSCLQNTTCQFLVFLTFPCTFPLFERSTSTNARTRTRQLTH